MGTYTSYREDLLDGLGDLDSDSVSGNECHKGAVALRGSHSGELLLRVIEFELINCANLTGFQTGNRNSN